MCVTCQSPRHLGVVNKLLEGEGQWHSRLRVEVCDVTRDKEVWRSDFFCILSCAYTSQYNLGIQFNEMLICYALMSLCLAYCAIQPFHMK